MQQSDSWYNIVWQMEIVQFVCGTCGKEQQIVKRYKQLRDVRNEFHNVPSYNLHNLYDESVSLYAE